MDEAQTQNAAQPTVLDWLVANWWILLLVAAVLLLVVLVVLWMRSGRGEEAAGPERRPFTGFGARLAAAAALILGLALVFVLRSGTPPETGPARAEAPSESVAATERYLASLESVVTRIHSLREEGRQ